MIGVFRDGIDESAGYLEEVRDASRKSFRIFNLWEEIPHPEFSGIVILGGNMSVNDERGYPFLMEEKRITRTMVARSRLVLGICLGAQMIASVFGARVYPCEKEVGWSPVTGIEPLQGIPQETTVFPWHRESFDLPDGAQIICCGERVKNQTFLWKSARGVQFHIEVTEEMIRKWTVDRDDRPAIARNTERFFQGSRQLCGRIAEAFIRGTSVNAC